MNRADISVLEEIGWEERIKARFSSGIFPDDPQVCSDITQKSWNI